ncbi:hypothetical protein O6H91_12G046700 [Diphasiastrum complanatum]|uniref:Uncharacterized protein n=2 Tax=Diphasiastrum complanatum TaxID=34168 RepID=A0ACC2C2E1_DIPCM|nr:hypothetical protein O6H91_12G046700 [Diphasiastrum complanatum]KAJ7535802.1 hypothetical protein O6H91_12G046700 [Diphasiastrum complanatum]
MRNKDVGNRIDPSKAGPDSMAALGDELLLNILRRQPPSAYPCSLVCKRWLMLHGLLRRSIKLQDWSFLESGRMRLRFPNLSDVDLTRACVMMARNGPAILITHRSLTIPLTPDVIDLFPLERHMQEQQLSSEALDRGLKVLAEDFPGLQRLSLVDVCSQLFCKGNFDQLDQWIAKGANKIRDGGPQTPKKVDKKAGPEKEKLPTLRKGDKKADMENEKPQTPKKSDKKVGSEKQRPRSLNQNTDLWLKTVHGSSPEDDARLDAIVQPIKAVSVPEKGLAIIAKNCQMLQELELYQCTDETLTVISACRNLQIVSLIGSLTDMYLGTFTDVGLTILANRCSRLVKLELAGCEGSYHGIKAIGQCCIMLEELTLSTDGFQPGWLAALSSCTCLKTLQLKRCKQIDADPGPAEYLGTCKALDQLQLVRCDLRKRQGFCALLSICRNVRELEFRDCWGLEDEVFSLTMKCRKVKLISLEGCSLLTTLGLENVILAWKELQRLRVVFCDGVKDTEISPALATCFASLKEFRWRPDTKSVLAISFAGTGVGQKGGKFFKKA